MVTTTNTPSLRRALLGANTAPTIPRRRPAQPATRVADPKPRAKARPARTTAVAEPEAPQHRSPLAALRRVAAKLHAA